MILPPENPMRDNSEIKNLSLVAHSNIWQLFYQPKFGEDEPNLGLCNIFQIGLVQPPSSQRSLSSPDHLAFLHACEACTCRGQPGGRWWELQGPSCFPVNRWGVSTFFIGWFGLGFDDFASWFRTLRWTHIYIYIAGWPGGFTSVGWRTEVFHPFETLWLPCDLGQLDNQQQPGWWFCRVYCGSWYYMLQLDAHPKAPPKRHWVPGETWAGSTPSCNSPTRCCPTPVQKFYVTPLLMGVFLHPQPKPIFFVGHIFFGLCVSSTLPMFNMEPPFPGVNFQVPCLTSGV